MYYRDYEQCLACFKNAMPTFFGSLNGFHEIVLILQKKIIYYFSIFLSIVEYFKVTYICLG